MVMNPYEITAGVAALANVIASNLTEEELALLVVVLAQLKDNLTAITVQRACFERFERKKNRFEKDGSHHSG